MAQTPCSDSLIAFKDNQFSVVSVTTDDLARLLKKELVALKATNCYYIGKESGLLPFLSIKDNLMMGVSKKEELAFQHRLIKWTHAFKLTAQLSSLYPENLSEEMLILIHLVRALSLERDLILINSSSFDSSLPFIESLAPLLRKAAAEKKIRIVLLIKKDPIAE